MYYNYPIYLLYKKKKVKKTATPFVADLQQRDLSDYRELSS
jgi:hypothetical protein